MVSIRIKVDRICLQKNFTILDLAIILVIGPQTLRDAINEVGDPGDQVAKAIEAYGDRAGLCPECFIKVIRQGACIRCSCGWSHCL